MSLRTSRWPAGIPCWADLTVPDVPAATAFYSAVLGWSFSEPDQEFGGYVIGSVRGAAAAGVGPQQQAGAPAAWTLYFASDDADGTARAVKEAGGEILLEPGDVGPLGRMFIGADPSGATFGVWQAGDPHRGRGRERARRPVLGGPALGRPGCRSRVLLRPLRLHHEGLEAAGPDYTLFFSRAGEAPLGGMGGMIAGSGRDTLPLARLLRGRRRPAAVQRAEERRRNGSDRALRDALRPMAALTDPAGAVFWISDPGGDRAARP